MDKAQVYAKHNRARVSPKKVNIVLDEIRGKSLHDAKLFLVFNQTKAARMILKVVKSAENNAKTNNNLNPENLYLSEVYVNGGRMYRTGRAGSKGRFDPLIKRTSHIVVGLSEMSNVKKTEEKNDEPKGEIKNKKKSKQKMVKSSVKTAKKVVSKLKPNVKKQEVKN